MSGNVQIDIPREAITAFCKKWKVAELSLFGSILREDFSPGSDVDVLVSFAEDAGWSLYDWVDMIEELKEIFGREVDLVSKKGLRNPFRRHNILNNRAVIYAARERRCAYLWGMLDAAKAVREFAAGRSFGDYLGDRMLRAAVERHLQIVGEAARRISPELRDAHPEIPWRRIIAQRNILVHEYGEIEHELMWSVATGAIPTRITRLEPLLPPEPD